MPAYLKTIPQPLCEWASCRATATRELFNTRNAPCGYYCIRHAAAALAEHEKRVS